MCYSYSDARAVIKTGDVVMIHGSWRHPLQALVMFFTSSKFSHCCIAFWITTPTGEERLLCVEAQGYTKRRMLSLSYYSSRKLTILAAPVPWELVEDDVLSRVGSAEYGWLTAMYVGVREYMQQKFNLALPRMRTPSEICSEFIARTYKLPYTDVSPQQLYNQLLSVTQER